MKHVPKYRVLLVGCACGASIGTASVANAGEYVVQLGDTPLTVATRYGMTVEELKAQNPKVMDNKEPSDSLPPMVLQVPREPVEEESFDIIAKRKFVMGTAQDSLRSVAARVKVSTVRLKQENETLLGNLRETDPFGEPIVIKLPLVQRGVVQYNVRQNESAEMVAAQCRSSGLRDVTVQGIKQANGLKGEPKADSVIFVPVSRQEQKSMLCPVGLAKGDVNFYRMPFIESSPVGQLKKGQPVVILSKLDTSDGGWYIVMSPDGQRCVPVIFVQETGKMIDPRVVMAQWEKQPKFNAPTPEAADGGGNTTPLAENVIKVADTYLGTKYVWGGTGRRGIDCSGLVLASAKQCGVTGLPRVSRDQARHGELVRKGQLNRGDRLYFSASGTHIDHTGIYLGRNKFVEANGYFGNVRHSKLFGPGTRNGNIFVFGRRRYPSERVAALTDDELVAQLVSETDPQPRAVAVSTMDLRGLIEGLVRPLLRS